MNCGLQYSGRAVRLKAKLPRNRLKGPEGVSGTALLFLDLGARRGWVVSNTPRPLYLRNDPVPMVQAAGGAPGPVWTCATNLAPTGIRCPDRPPRRQSLYGLSYPGPGGKNSRRKHEANFDSMWKQRRHGDRGEKVT
jgi:hypothetical protein